MKHARTVSQYPDTHEQLAEDIGNFYYDALAEFLKLFSAKLARDAIADQGRGRLKLANELDAGAQHLAAAAQHIESAWRICKPYVSTVSQTGSEQIRGENQ
jgi:hypothetical protein